MDDFQKRVFYMLAGTMCFLFVIFGVAAIFIPDFRTQGALIVGVILGPIVAPVAAGLGLQLTKAMQSERQKRDEKGNGDS